MPSKTQGLFALEAGHRHIEQAVPEELYRSCSTQVSPNVTKNIAVLFNIVTREYDFSKKGREGRLRSRGTRP